MADGKARSLKHSMKLPVIMAPMFLISKPKMVVEACVNGIAGTFPALNARTGEDLEKWMEEISTSLEKRRREDPTATVAPWGINFIVHRSNKRYEEDLKRIGRYQPPIVITSLGDPSPVIKVVHEYGGTVFSDVINPTFARKAVEKGADGLILVANGAGGHAGVLNPVSFLHEVREFFDGPVVLGGGLSKGEDILAAEVLGADFAYMGTRFIPTAESAAPEEYKEMIVDSAIEDIIYTDAFSGIHANYLIPSITKAGLDPSKLEKKEEINFNKSGSDTKAWKDIWGAGHGIGSIRNIQTVAEIVAELDDSYQKAVDRLERRFNLQGSRP
ncbi:NAD(P)H-dependent flavin oxidoreductase [Virgibacillus xinjiangensis]|uniref:Probable nitronate monooxygenase n=1 Tax=Virgibacillus xinjiangensis TaxID=393090 RepID=A0ABV7CZ93_9BACI